MAARCARRSAQVGLRLDARSRSSAAAGARRLRSRRAGRRSPRAATARPSRAAASTRSMARAARSRQSCAAAKPLSTSSSSGPRPALLAPRVPDRPGDREDQAGGQRAGAGAGATRACGPAFPARAGGRPGCCSGGKSIRAAAAASPAGAARSPAARPGPSSDERRGEGEGQAEHPSGLLSAGAARGGDQRQEAQGRLARRAGRCGGASGSSRGCGRAPRSRRDARAMRVAIGLAPGGGIADAQRQAVFEIVQHGLAREGKGLLDRVDDHDEMAARAARRDGLDRRGDLGAAATGNRRSGSPRRGGRRRARAAGPRRGRPSIGHERLAPASRRSGAVARGGIRPSRPTRSPPSTKRVGRARGRARARARSSSAWARSDAKPIEAERSIQSQIAVGGLPFALAHVEPVVAAGAAPVDPLGGLAGHEGPELPEGLAGPARRRPWMPCARLAATRRASRIRRGIRCGERERRSGLVPAGRAARAGEDPDAGHRARPSPPAARPGGR